MNSSHADLINSLRQSERLTDKTAQTMLQVDRRYFLDPDNLEVLHHAYQVHASIQPLAIFLDANYASLCLPTVQQFKQGLRLAILSNRITLSQ